MNATCAITAGLLGVMLGACGAPEADRGTDSAVPRSEPSVETRATAGEERDASKSKVPEAVVSSHRWATRIRPDEAVRISNDYGDIRIELGRC
jgi:hypothetical protein